MGGSQFEQKHFQLHDIKETLDEITRDHRLRKPGDKDQWGYELEKYPEDLLEAFDVTSDLLSITELMVQRIDYLISQGSDAESYRERVKEDLVELRKNRTDCKTDLGVKFINLILKPFINRSSK